MTLWHKLRYINYSIKAGSLADAMIRLQSSGANYQLQFTSLQSTDRKVSPGCKKLRLLFLCSTTAERSVRGLRVAAIAL